MDEDAHNLQPALNRRRKPLKTAKDCSKTSIRTLAKPKHAFFGDDGTGGILPTGFFLPNLKSTKFADRLWNNWRKSASGSTSGKSMRSLKRNTRIRSRPLILRIMCPINWPGHFTSATASRILKRLSNCSGTPANRASW